MTLLPARAGSAAAFARDLLGTPGRYVAAALPDLPYACGLNTVRLLADDIPRAAVLAGVEQVRAAFGRRRRTAVERLSQMEGLTVPVPRGAFYAYPSVKGLLGREHDGRDDRDDHEQHDDPAVDE